jgi:hypothetical protein
LNLSSKTTVSTVHDTDTAKADLDLEGLTRSIVDVADAQNWQDILDQLNSGEMPPKKKAQPGKEELAKVVGDLTESLQSAQKCSETAGGKSPCVESIDGNMSRPSKIYWEFESLP